MFLQLVITTSLAFFQDVNIINVIYISQKNFFSQYNWYLFSKPFGYNYFVYIILHKNLLNWIAFLTVFSTFILEILDKGIMNIIFL